MEERRGERTRLKNVRTIPHVLDSKGKFTIYKESYSSCNKQLYSVFCVSPMTLAIVLTIRKVWGFTRQGRSNAFLCIMGNVVLSFDNPYTPELDKKG